MDEHIKRIERPENELAEEKIRREKSERASKEDRLGREKSERASKEEKLHREQMEFQIRLTTIPELLDLYNKLSTTIKVEQKPMVLTSGDISIPAGRKYPKRIIPWENFACRQQEIWSIISASATYSERLFKSLCYVESQRVQAVSWSTSLVANEEVTILEPAGAILREFYNNKELRQQLHLLDNVTFVSNLSVYPGNQDLGTLTPLDRSSKSEGANVNLSIKSEEYTRDLLCQADKYCIIHLKNREQKLLYNIQYKLPFALLAADIVQGLRGEILPDRDLMHKDDRSLKFYTLREVSAVITQLFSCLIKNGVQYGYVSTGDTMIFVHISDDPEQIEYHIWSPQDFDFNQPSSLHNTALAEVIAFSLQALAAKPPHQNWHDAAANLETWAVEDAKILEDIPESVQNERIKRNMHANKSSRSENLCYSSSTALRLGHQAKHTVSRDKKGENDKTGSSNFQPQNLRCRLQDLKSEYEYEDLAKERGEGSSSGPSNRAEISNVGRAWKKRKGDRDEPTGRLTENSRKHVLDRDYCSRPCLLGLTRGDYLDQNCPNIADHGEKHLTPLEFLRLVQEQLARDRGHVTDCEPLWIRGSRGAMFKVTLTSHGYTVIAKGVQHHDVPHLIHEAKVYRHLRSIQGIHIPVCIGSTNLILPYYHKGAKFVCFLFQSYAGSPVHQSINAESKADILSNITYAVTAIHRLHVLHCDLMPSNILTDEKSGSVQIIDFERAKIREKRKEVVSSNKMLLLGASSANERITSPASPFPKEPMTEDIAEQDCEEVKEKGDSEFDRELRNAIWYIDNCVH